MASPPMSDPFGHYIAHLVEEVARVANFSPTLTTIPNYPNTLEGAAYTMVAADLTMSEERERAMDFSIPFMRVGLVILLKRPATVSDMFSFLRPFSLLEAERNSGYFWG